LCVCGQNSMHSRTQLHSCVLVLHVNAVFLPSYINLSSSCSDQSPHFLCISLPFFSFALLIMISLFLLRIICILNSNNQLRILLCMWPKLHAQHNPNSLLCSRVGASICGILLPSSMIPSSSCFYSVLIHPLSLPFRVLSSEQPSLSLS
jgi:hypothetical protein